MSLTQHSLSEFLAAESGCALVEVVAAKGSTPREAGSWMLVSSTAILGTIGGGQLEYMAIDKARQLLGGKDSAWRAGSPVKLMIPLGPEIGQCCGGSVELVVRRVDADVRQRVLSRAAAADVARPHIYVFGAGHVGCALAAALSLLPVRTIIVETRAAELEALPAGLETKLTSVPEELVSLAPAGSSFVVLTHDHALDFLIVAEALKRADAAYVGMIGSKTKRATFKSWFLKQAEGSLAAVSALTCPIGGDTVKDKRPAVIAALTAAELAVRLLRTPLTVSAAPAEIPRK